MWTLFGNHFWKNAAGKAQDGSDLGEESRHNRVTWPRVGEPLSRHDVGSTELAVAGSYRARK
jgi:hypothetical protein